MTAKLNWLRFNRYVIAAKARAPAPTIQADISITSLTLSIPDFIGFTMVRMSNAVGAAGKAEGQVYSMKFIVDKKNEKDSCHVHELNERIMATATYRDDGDGHGHGLDAIDQ